MCIYKYGPVDLSDNKKKNEAKKKKKKKKEHRASSEWFIHLWSIYAECSVSLYYWISNFSVVLFFFLFFFYKHIASRTRDL